MCTRDVTFNSNKTLNYVWLSPLTSSSLRKGRWLSWGEQLIRAEPGFDPGQLVPKQCFCHFYHILSHQMFSQPRPLVWTIYLHVFRGRHRHRELSQKPSAHGHLTSDCFLRENRDGILIWQRWCWGTCFPGTLGQNEWPDFNLPFQEPFAFAYSWLQGQMWPFLALWFLRG